MVAQNPVDRPALIKWVKAYSFITLGAVLYGIAAAHIPFLIGKPWSSCKQGGSDLGCVLTFHLFEVPPVLFNTYIAWYGLKRFSFESVRFFRSLLVFAAMFNFVFFAFECNLLMTSQQRQAPDWENIALTSISLILIGGTGLAIYVHQRLIAVSSD